MTLLLEGSATGAPEQGEACEVALTRQLRYYAGLIIQHYEPHVSPHIDEPYLEALLPMSDTPQLRFQRCMRAFQSRGYAVTMNQPAREELGVDFSNYFRGRLPEKPDVPYTPRLNVLIAAGWAVVIDREGQYDLHLPDTNPDTVPVKESPRADNQLFYAVQRFADNPYSVTI